MTDAFDRLDPALQYQIAYGLGFSSLRPVQELTVDAVLDGANVVVLAPTAGGKTEAAFFPLLSKVLAGNLPGPSILYLTPIKALINNQEERLTRLTGLVGRRAFKWHGDVSDSRRRAFLREPADVLLTTPESLEAMLVSSRVGNEIVFGNLHAVVIDEVHAFAGDDRGGHLAAVLERIQRIAGRDLQRVGLSATVGNPEVILDWMQGSSRRERRLVDPPKPARAPEIQLDYVKSVANAALVIEKLHPGRKRLVFADSRRKVEQLGRALDQRGVRTFVMHSSLSAAERSLAEREFSEGRDCVIVATSAMELGIDIGDLDHVLQIDSPRTVASFLQRMGRTGRRADTTPNCTFLCTKPDQLLQAAALLDLHARGFIEPVHPVLDGPHLFAHQALAMTLERGELPRGELHAALRGATMLANTPDEDLDAVLTYMVSEAILTEDDGLLRLGEQGHRLFGAKNFLDLYAVFEASQDFTVFHGRNEIGFLAPLWVAQKGKLGAEFTLGGKPWQVRGVDHRRRRVDVARGERGGSIGWVGTPVALGYDLCRTMWSVLRGEAGSPAWTRRTTEEIDGQRDACAGVPADGVERLGAGFRWFTYAGSGVNGVLAPMLEAATNSVVRFDNFAIEVQAPADGRMLEALETITGTLRDAATKDPAELDWIAASLDPALLGKFAPCIPGSIARRLLTTRLLDLDGVRTLKDTLLPSG